MIENMNCRYLYIFTFTLSTHVRAHLQPNAPAQTERRRIDSAIIPMRYNESIAKINVLT